MGIFKKGRFYHYEFEIDGVRVQKSTRQGDRETAKTMMGNERSRQARIKAGLESPDPKPKQTNPTIKELLDVLENDYKIRGKGSVRNLSHIARARKDFGATKAAELTAERVDAYIQKRMDAGAAPASINRVTQLLRQAYKLSIAKKQFQAAAPPIRRLSEKGNERQGFLHPAEFQKVLGALPDDLKDFCQWGYATGMRKGETSLLTWHMIEGDELHVPGDITKNRKPRTLPLSGELAEIIERRRAARLVKQNGTARMVEFVFHRDGEPVQEFRKSWATACAKAGVAGTRYHDLRRSCARNLTQAGVPRELAKKVTGHVSDSMWERYNIVVTDDLRAALEKTEKYRTAAKESVVSMPRRAAR